MEEKPLVSICCTTYNHEKYIKECLDGILMQKTIYPFEIIIHDDASTDTTPQIISQYVKKYPTLIKPILQKENQYSKGIEICTQFVFPKAQGKYIAMCEGDDYWIDPLKIQKQIDILEKNIHYSAVFANYRIQDERNNNIKEYITNYSKKLYNEFDVLAGVMFGIHSICFRKSVIDYDLFHRIKSNGDLIINYLCTRHGYVFRIEGILSTYRLTGKGVASSRDRIKQYEAAIKERYHFHQQLNFPNNNALILSQVYATLAFIKNNRFSINIFNYSSQYFIKGKIATYLYYIFKCISYKLLRKSIF